MEMKPVNGLGGKWAGKVVIRVTGKMTQPVQNINHSAFRSMFEREKLSRNNFNDWFRQLKLVLRVEKKIFVIKQPLPAAPAADSNAQVLSEWNAIYDAHNELKAMFEKQAGVERFDLIQIYHACKQEEGLILNGLTKDFSGFVRNYNMHNMGKKVGELHAMLIEYEKGLPKKDETPQVMMIKVGKIQKANNKSLKVKGKGKANGKGKDKQVYIPKPSAKSTQLRMTPAATTMSKKRIENLQQEGLLKSTDDESFDQCISCLPRKMTRKSFPHRPERATDLLGIIHIDVFKNEVENQLRKTIKALRSDRGGKYISQEFKDYLKACGIIQQLTPPYTPQHNGMSERRNHTLLDMVRSMMNLTTLPLSFWDYALESTTRILNMVPTKKVDKTLYELWYGKVPNLSYLKVWGCEALVKRDMPDKLQQRSVKCVFIGYPKETMGYYFYFPPENKIVVARYITLITSEIPMEVEGFEPPQEEDILIHRSERTRQAPNRLSLNVEAEEHSLGDLNERTSYKAVMLDSKSNKWIDAMNAEIQSMMDNMVWVMVDLPPSCKTVGIIHHSSHDIKRRVEVNVSLFDMNVSDVAGDLKVSSSLVGRVSKYSTIGSSLGAPSTSFCGSSLSRMILMNITSPSSSLEQTNFVLEDRGTNPSDSSIEFNFCTCFVAMETNRSGCGCGSGLVSSRLPSSCSIYGASSWDFLGRIVIVLIELWVCVEYAGSVVG
ncbi:retrotransposon protein, putative, ty1-copia subclass [Tanacetum coccineum]|uniref:Retrotransposon protein, putative, ty1-copia subclass n=1 Tax=Tanacetum coccineum TaxID=301880 RepID=A0ABQ4ZNL2_9ASTR